MNSISEARGRSPEFRTTVFYFTQFMGSGATVTVLPIWLSEKGITPDQIGIINALPMLAMLLLNVLVGRIADRASDWRSVIIIGCILTAAIPVGLFFVNEFWGVLLVWTLASLPNAAVGPVADAAAMRMTRRRGTDYGTIRAWGTVGYMLFNAITGFLVAWYGAAIFVPLFIALTALRAVTAMTLPKFRAPAQQPTLAANLEIAGRAREMLKWWFVLPLFCFAMVAGTHYIVNAFAALLWKQQGISESVIGPLIALGAFAEAGMMFAWRRVASRFSARNLILFSALVAAVRWSAMAFSPPVLVLIALQLLQAFTFSMGLLASVHFITNWTSEEIAAEAQGYFVMLQQVMSVIALLGFGWLVGGMGPHAYLVAGGFALMGALCVLISIRMMGPKTRPVAANG
ncbi:MAG TPA: MFS transporter [Devosiaceae bacterium]|jgi:PPP family 3-phenylpropionic acid transporter